MKEIQVGECVRTKNGIIGTINEISKAGNGVRYAGEFITDTIVSIWTKPHKEVRVKDKEIINHDFDITKLIEAGDYVNGYLVEVINYEEDEKGNLFDILGVVFTDDDFAYTNELKDINIDSIVTKEQFKSMEYKVGGEDERSR